MTPPGGTREVVPLAQVRALEPGWNLLYNSPVLSQWGVHHRNSPPAPVFIIKSTLLNRKSRFLVSKSGFLIRKSGFFY